jgi:hypothetical protein
LDEKLRKLAINKPVVFASRSVVLIVKISGLLCLRLAVRLEVKGSIVMICVRDKESVCGLAACAGRGNAEVVDN